jgi:starvation-inducible DNA-binding protein
MKYAGWCALGEASVARHLNCPFNRKTKNKIMNTKLYETKNNLPANTRSEMINLLNQNLADILDLQLQAKHAHWNVKGPGFFSLHELFDKVAEELEGFADEIAERAVALGGTALGTARLAVANSRLPEYPADLSAGGEHVAVLSSALGALGKSVREAIEAATKAGDADTSDLFTGVSRSVDKLLWFVEAHAQ